MYECTNCFLLFRFPRISIDKLNELYISGVVGAWSPDISARPDWQLVINRINLIRVGSKILDAGCFDGRFLSNLKGYERYGVEIHPGARKIAENIGIEILSENIYDNGELEIKFDIVTALDIVEHAENPFLFVNSLIDVLKPAGYLFISTGDTDCLCWKIMKSRYYYCTIAEHISFINRRWLARIADKLSCSIVPESVT